MKILQSTNNKIFSAVRDSNNVVVNVGRGVVQAWKGYHVRGTRLSVQSGGHCIG